MKYSLAHSIQETFLLHPVKGKRVSSSFSVMHLNTKLKQLEDNIEIKFAVVFRAGHTHTHTHIGCQEQKPCNFNAEARFTALEQSGGSG